MPRKFYRTDFAGTRTGPYTAEEAVKYQMERASYLEVGTIERVQAQLDELAEIVGHVIEANEWHHLEAARAIGWQWEEEE